MKYKTVDELPLMLTVKDVSEILGISLGKTYELCHSKKFPCVTVTKRMVIPKLAFVKWMENPYEWSNK